MKTIEELEKLDREITLDLETPRKPTLAVNIFMGFLMLFGIALFCLFTYGIIYLLLTIFNMIFK